MTALATSMRQTSLLRLALRLDAVVSGACGLAYLAAPGALEDLLGVSSGTLLGIGAFMVAYAAAVWFVSLAEAPNRLAVRVIIVGNTGWMLASLVLAALDWATPTTAGIVWIVLQALTVGGFVAMQAAGLRRTEA